MTSPTEEALETLLRAEREKLALLKAKVVESEQRIRVLESCMTPRDEMDDWLAKKVSGQAGVSTETKVSQPRDHALEKVTFQPPKRRLSFDTTTLLLFIGREGKDLNEIRKFVLDRNLGIKPDAVRAFANNYKAKYQALESTRPGFFRLTEGAEAHLRSLEREMPASAIAGISDVNQAAVQGGPNIATERYEGGLGYGENP